MLGLGFWRNTIKDLYAAQKIAITGLFHHMYAQHLAMSAAFLALEVATEIAPMMTIAKSAEIRGAFLETLSQRGFSVA